MLSNGRTAMERMLGAFVDPLRIGNLNNFQSIKKTDSATSTRPIPAIQPIVRRLALAPKIFSGCGGFSRAGGVAMREALDSRVSTAATNLYPCRGRVSTYRGWS